MAIISVSHNADAADPEGIVQTRLAASGAEGELSECDEGELVWVDKQDVLEKLPVWEGDKIFLRLLSEGAPFFSLKLRYENKVLKSAVLDGEKIF